MYQGMLIEQTLPQCLLLKSPPTAQVGASLANLVPYKVKRFKAQSDNEIESVLRNTSQYPC